MSKMREHNISSVSTTNYNRTNMNISTRTNASYSSGFGVQHQQNDNDNDSDYDIEGSQQRRQEPTVLKMLKYYFFHKRTTDNSILLPWKRRIMLLVFAIFQNGLAGGLIFGWASIDKTMLAEQPTKGGAGLDEYETTVMFAYSSCVAMFSTFILGVLLDTKGPRICSVVCCASVGLGCQIFAYANNFIGFVIGACLLGLGGPAIGSSIIHIANLFPNNEFLVMSCLSGSIAFSFSILAIFGMIWDKYDNITYQHLFGWYAWIVYALALGAIVLYPDEPYEEFIDDDINDLLFDELLLQEKPMKRQHEKDTSSTTNADSETAELLLSNKKSLSDNGSKPSSSYSANSRVILQRDNLNVNDRTERHSAPIRLITTHDDDRHYHHIQSVTTGRLLIEQPLDSYLRESSSNRESYQSHNPKMMVKTDSFKAAESVLKEGDTAMAYQISLKDQPFTRQLFSPAYIRALVIFITTCFVTNFYVASLSTELGDLQYYSPSRQHQMTTDFTIIMSMGMIVSVVVGFLIDLLGIEICTAITLISGVIQNLILLAFGQDYNLTLLSFIFYTIFRQFLYPVFIASLTSRLGFKYFGVLLGIGFAIAGIAQPAFTILSETLQGDCHTLDLDDNNDHDGGGGGGGGDESFESVSTTSTTICDHGHWILAHVLQIVLLVSLLIIPWLDYKDRIQREERIKEVLSSTSLSTNNIDNNNRDTNKQPRLTTYGSGDL